MKREEEIKEIAYYIWEQDGCCDGNSLKHWVQAEMIWESRQKGPAAETGEDARAEKQPEFQKTTEQPAAIKPASTTPKSSKGKKTSNK